MLRLLRRCLEKDPARRLRHIGDARLELDEGAPARRSATRARQRAPPIAGSVLRSGRSQGSPRAGSSRGSVCRSWTSVQGTAPAQPPATFVIRAPAASTFGVTPTEPFPALSPDGRRLAFVAPLGSRSVLWVQTIGNPEAAPLSGTDGAQLPFWSPDGGYIAFHSGTSLKRISASGAGVPQEIAPMIAPRGGAWSVNGTIVLGASGPLEHVSADGGEVRPLTRLDQERGEFSHRFPVMLPGGERFVYLVLSTQERQQGLYLGSISDPELKTRLRDGDTNAAIGDGRGRPRPFVLRA